MKRYILELSILFIFISSYSNAQNQIVESLDGTWMFAIDSTNRGIKEKWPNGLPQELSKKVQVPHTWNIETGTEEYAGMAWYQKTIEVPKAWKGKNVRVKFGAVYHDAVVFVNGKKVGENLNSGYTPFTVDITKYIKVGSPNTLVVSVNNAYSEKTFPYKRAFDWGNDGGIIRSVQLELTGTPSFRYVHVDPQITLKDSSGIAHLSIKLWEDNIKKSTFEFTVRHQQSQDMLLSRTEEITSVNGIFQVTLELGKISPWHFDHPNLYELTTSVNTKNGITDIERSVFGFRKTELRGSDFLLNGEKVRLPGIEYMPGSNPKYGIAEPRSYMDSVVQSMKDLNVCITRFHWQQDEYMLGLMDKYGILVQEELPWWQEPARLTPELVDTAHKQLEDMIEAHYNHPSIFSWGISNEVNGDTEKDRYLELIDFVKGIDSTRFVTIVANRIWQKKDKDETLLGDIPTWNDYIGTWHGKDRTELSGKLDTIKSAIGERPLLITENGLSEPANMGGDTRRIDDMIYHIKHWSERPWIIGYIYFSLNDYRTQMGEEGFGKYQIRRHGITSVALDPKPSFDVLKQIAAPIDITQVTRTDDETALIEIKVKSNIPKYTLRSYKLRYETLYNEVKEITLPDLKPGDTFSTELKHVNPRFSFEITRPNDFEVISY